MSDPEKALAQRIRELRRRQYGPRGKAEFARRLDVPLDEYERYERATIPPGDVLVRMCEATGEDLQWLLTGVASRGTVVISQARTRHQDLLTRLAQLLDEKPTLAAPVEAFVDLLVTGETAEAGIARRLPTPTPRDLIPIFEDTNLPLHLPTKDAPFALAPSFSNASVSLRQTVSLAEPAGRYEPDALRPIEVLTLRAEDGADQQCVCSAEIAGCFPDMFAVRLHDDTMAPMFGDGDAALASPGSVARIGRPALCRLADDPRVRCRIWLGEDETGVNLGRLADGAMEHVERANVSWSLEVLYRLAAA